jgi:hypothetical protein
MMKLCDIVWPTLEGWKPSELAGHHRGNFDEISSIKQARWSVQPGLALQEAKHLADEEDGRRRTAEAKASTYLLVAAALVPILTYLENAIWDQKAGTTPKWASLPILILAVAYLLRGAQWAFRTLQVGTYVRLDAEDLLNIWDGTEDPQPRLITEMLIATRRNRDTVNAKVSTIKMAHEFLIRAFLMFAALLLLESILGVLVGVSAFVAHGEHHPMNAANIATTRIYDHRRTRREGSQTRLQQ